MAQNSPVASFCESGNEPSGFMKKTGYSLMSNYWLFKKHPAPWS